MLKYCNYNALESKCKGYGIPCLRRWLVDKERMTLVSDFPCFGISVCSSLQSFVCWLGKRNGIWFVKKSVPIISRSCPSGDLVQSGINDCEKVSLENNFLYIT